MAHNHDNVQAHLCPVWVGYFMASRLRRLLQNPYRILAPYVKPDMAVLDVGSAMGFFSLPMAEMVGPGGKVVCIDVQPRMLELLRRRAHRAGLSDRIETHVACASSIGLEGQSDCFDFVLAFAVLHEVQDQRRCLGEIHRLLKGGSSLLVAEPARRVTTAEFDRTVALASEAGMIRAGRPEIRLCHAAVLNKPAEDPRT